MKRALVALLALGALVGSATSTSATGSTVHALVWQKNTVSLATLDARTLAPRGRVLPLGRASGSVASDRLGERLAVASAGAGVVVVDTKRMRVVWRVAGPRPHVRAVSWLSPRRLLVVQHGSAVLLDPVRKRVVAQSVLEGTVRAAAAWRDGLVLLVGETYDIAPVRIVVVGPGVRVRMVELGRIPAGAASSPTNEHAFNHAQPGFAVDPLGGRVHVAGGMLVATVDLRTLAVAYGGAQRTPQKLITGPRRSAALLSDGTLAVAGADDRWTDAGATSTPFGLRYVRGGSVTIVDERATQVTAAGPLALAFGHHRDDTGRLLGIGLAAYDPSGALRWRLFGEKPVAAVQVAQGLGYVEIETTWWHVVDLATGSTIGGAVTPRWDHFEVLGGA